MRGLVYNSGMRKLKIMQLIHSPKLFARGGKIILVISAFLAMGFNSVHAQDITTGLIGHWKFDETSGTTATDSSGNNNTGTLTNGPTWTTGKIGNALSFDGVNDTVNIITPNNIPNGNSNETYSAWIKYSSLPTFTKMIMMARDTCCSSAIHIWINNTNLAVARFSDVEPFVSTSNRPSANQWHHVLYTYDGTTNRLYVDGAEVANSTTAHDNVTIDSIYIGSHDGASYFWDGQIDEVRVYNRVLASSDISALYALGSGPPDTTAPSTPTNLTTTVVSSSQINLSWTASTDNIGVTGYRVYRGGTQIASPSTTSYSDTGLSPSAIYSYTVAAVDGAGNISSQSTNAQATTQAPPPPDTQAPTAPTNLIATAQSSSQINLSWTASTDNVGVTGYRVERCTGSTCTTFAQIATPSTNSYNDTGLTANTTYRYRVRAVDATNNISSYSSIVNGTTQSTPPPTSGMEQKCGELGGNCVCSEPLNTNILTPVGSSWYNPADSTVNQCTTEGLSGGAITRNSNDIFGSNDSVARSALPAGNTVNYVVRGPDGHIGTWFVGHGLMPTSKPRLAARFYIYHSPDFEFAGDGLCQNSKLMEFGSDTRLDKSFGIVHTYNFLTWSVAVDSLLGFIPRSSAAV